ncbi:MAG: MFS transporter [Clostridia bacterium]|nr:MFS transporter [Clostridia bacterium]
MSGGGAGPDAAPPPLWRHRPFLLLLGGYALSGVGDHFFDLAVEWHVYASSGSSLQVAAVGVAFQLAYTLIGPVAGVLADRWDRRRTLIVCDALRGLIVMGAAAVAWLAVLPFWAAASTVFVLEAIGQFFYASRQPFIPLVVPRAELVAANGALSGAGHAAGIAGRAFGGVVVSAAGTAVAILSDAVSFWISAACVWLIRTPRPSLAEERPVAAPSDAAGEGQRGGWARFWSEMKEGWGAIAGIPLIRTLVVYAVLINFAYAMIQPVFPAYVATQLRLGAWALGLIQSAILVGGLSGGLLAGTVSRRVPAGRAVILSFSSFALVMVAIGLSGSLEFALALWALFGFTLTVQGAATQALEQALIPQAVMGRAVALSSALSMALMPLGTLLGGYAGNLVGAGAVLTAVGVFEALLALLLAGNPGLRRADVREVGPAA